MWGVTSSEFKSPLSHQIEKYNAMEIGKPITRSEALEISKEIQEKAEESRDPFVDPIPDGTDNVPEKWIKLVKFVEDIPEYELCWVFEWPNVGTVDSSIFETYAEANYILGPDRDLVIVPLIREKDL